MNYTLKLALAGGLALLAAWANKKYLESHMRTENYVTVNAPVAKGEKLTADKLTGVALGGQTQDLRRLAIPYRERATVEDRVSPRDLVPGELLRVVDFANASSKPVRLRPDEMAIPVPLANLNVDLATLRVSQWVYFTIVFDERGNRTGVNEEPAKPLLKNIGPFRIVAIGTHTEEDYQSNVSGSQSDRQITVAGRYGPDGTGFDDKTDQLQRAIHGNDGKLRAILPHNDAGARRRPAANAPQGAMTDQARLQRPVSN